MITRDSWLFADRIDWIRDQFRVWTDWLRPGRVKRRRPSLNAAMSRIGSFRVRCLPRRQRCAPGVVAGDVDGGVARPGFLAVHWTYVDVVLRAGRRVVGCGGGAAAEPPHGVADDAGRAGDDRPGAAASGAGLTEFVVSSAVNEAQRLLADRDRFELDEVAAEAWEAMNARPARDLPGLRRLMERPSPFGT